MAKAKTKTDSSPVTHKVGNRTIIGDAPTSAALLATEIKKVSEAANALMRSGLKDKALWVLLQHSTGLSQAECRRVVEACSDLAANYLKR